jgi:hypothetical protein
MVACKRCHAAYIVKNGMARNKQRYRCKSCAYHFVAGDRRVSETLVVKKALAVLLYALGKASLTMLGKIFGHSPSLVYCWMVEEAATLPDPSVPGDIREMGFDEMGHVIGSQKTNSGSSGPWIVAQGAPWPG